MTRKVIEPVVVEPTDYTGMLKGVLRPCNKLLAEAGPFHGTCPRCGKGYIAA